MRYDLIAIGGSYAGMAAALQLLRARRHVLMIDAAQRRNRFARHSHGFLGQDGVDPEKIALDARRQLEAYPTLTWIDGRAVAVAGEPDDFTVTTAEGQALEGRRVLLATGVEDQLPLIPGLAERWGRAVFHCPYCHGFELNRGKIGVIATGPMSVHQAELVSEWGEVTFLTNGVVELDADARTALRSRDVTIESTLIDRLDDHADVVLNDGRRLSLEGLFIASRYIQASPLAEDAGCTVEETPMGIQILVDASKETTIPGIYACGDMARAPHSVSFAVGDGALAGMHVHRSLMQL